jgi:predicted AAA+ superfamily ATPase
MREIDFDGTLVLEQLARIDKVAEFMDAVDSDDVKRASALMKSAGIEAETIALVLKKMADPDDQH